MRFDMRERLSSVNDVLIVPFGGVKIHQQVNWVRHGFYSSINRIGGNRCSLIPIGGAVYRIGDVL